MKIIGPKVNGGQPARLFDMIFFGPFALLSAAVAKDMPTWSRLALAFGGAYAIVNNATNYAASERIGKEVSKQQWLRVYNAALAGPFMVWYGSRTKSLGRGGSATLTALGAATTAYNSYNFVNYAKDGHPLLPPREESPPAAGSQSR